MPKNACKYSVIQHTTGQYVTRFEIKHEMPHDFLHTRQHRESYLLSLPFPLAISRARYCDRLAFRMPPSVSSLRPTPTAPLDAAAVALDAAAAVPAPPPGLVAAALAFTLLFT